MTWEETDSNSGFHKITTVVRGMKICIVYHGHIYQGECIGSGTASIKCEPSWPQDIETGHGRLNNKVPVYRILALCQV